MASSAELDADARSFEQLAAAAMVENQMSDEEFAQATGAFAVLRWRSGPQLLRRAIQLTTSADWMERELGVDLLGQIHDPAYRGMDPQEAWSSRPDIVHGYLEETMQVLLALTATETYPDVVDSLAWAFGNRRDPRGIPALATFAASERAHVRLGAAHSLPGCSIHPDPGASPDEWAAAIEIAHQIAAPLIDLADDSDSEVRDWALFGLHQLDIDSPRIRDVFLRHLDDSHHDAMTEAFHGLANLGDPRGLEPLVQLLATGEDSAPIIEACEAYGDPRFVPALSALRADDHSADDDDIDRALAACTAARGWQPIIGRWPKRD